MTDTDLNHDPRNREDDLRLSAVFTVIGRHRLLFATVVLLGISLACAVALIRTPQFKATAKLSVEPNLAYVPITADEDDASVASSYADTRGTEAEINATVSMLKSSALIRRVFEENSGDGPAEIKRSRLKELVGRVRELISMPESIYLKLHRVPEADPLDRAVARAQTKLSVRPLDKANIIEVSYSDPDARWSARFVNELIRTYLSPSSMLEEEDSRLRFLQEQRSLFERKLRAAKKELRSFQAGPALGVAFDKEEDVRQLLAKLELDKAETRAELAGVEAQLASIGAERKRLGSSVPVDPMIAKIAPIDDLASNITALELERTRLLTRYQPQSLTVTSLDQDIAKARSLLAEQMKTASLALVRSGVAGQRLALQLVEARVERDRLAAKLAMLESDTDTCAQKLEALDRLSEQRNRLSVKLRTVEAAYATYLNKEEQARFARELRRAGIRNEALAEAAQVPAFPQPSGVMRILALGIVLSLFAATGLVLIIDRGDDRLNTVADAEAITGSPLLGLVAYDDAEDADEVAVPEHVIESRPRGMSLASRSTVVSVLLAVGGLVALGTVLAVLSGRVVPERAQSEAGVLATATTVLVDTRPTDPPALPSSAATPPSLGSGTAVASPGVWRVVVHEDASEREPEGEDGPAEVEEGIVVVLPALVSAVESGALHEPSAELEPESAPEPIAEPTSASDAHLVVIDEGMTLYSLILDHYGAYTPRHLALVRDANPSLADPALIVAGATLHLPSLEPSSAGSGGDVR